MYRMKFDYHTHTIYSHGPVRPHGKGTIEQNVRTAAEKGLDAIAISEHGPGHRTYGLKMEKLPEMRAEIERLKKIYPVEIYLSVEANIVNRDNYLDVKPEEYDLFDFVNAGYHFGVTDGYCMANWMYDHRFWRGNKDELIEKNTKMIVAAIENNDIRILTHPGEKAPVDMNAIAKACEKTGTWMEISTHHAHLTPSEIEICQKYDVSFVISSDAHMPHRVGTFKTGITKARIAGLDLDRIVNIEKI